MKNDFIINTCILLITLLVCGMIYLLYQNYLAEDMLQELNQDYEDLVNEYNGKKP